MLVPIHQAQVRLNFVRTGNSRVADLSGATSPLVALLRPARTRHRCAVHSTPAVCHEGQSVELASQFPAVNYTPTASPHVSHIALALFSQVAIDKRISKEAEPRLLCGLTTRASEMGPSRWSVAVHAGAGPWIPMDDAESRDRNKGLRDALEAAAMIMQSPSKLDGPYSGAPAHVAAAVAAVESMEENPLFNAGTGAALNAAGSVENEASIMDGGTMRTGAVAGLTTVALPIRLALLVRLKAAYQFIGFQHAERFADDFPSIIERRPNESFITESRRKQLLDDPHVCQTPQEVASKGPETVGAVVCNIDTGDLACATSTGGFPGKICGRIGDTPMVGAGSYAQNGVCALSGTGVGEEFLRFSAAARVCGMVEYGKKPLPEALATVVHGCFPDDTGGFIAVDPAGGIFMDSNSPYFARGRANSEGLLTTALAWDAQEALTA